MFNLPPSQGETPIYKPSFHESLSPREMWKEEPKAKPEVAIPEAPKEYAEEGREAYRNLSNDEKNLMCAGLVLSNAWRKFLRPYLESYADPIRKPIRNQDDYYELLNNNAIAAFCEGLITALEGKARRSPSYDHTE